MRKKNIILLLPMLFLIQNNIYGQKEHTVDMYPKTPDAAAASKFADIPAGNYTGVADFSIPIYTITTKGGSIPISLQYTTTGIKVSEIASRVGLGWSLNVGPSLSQQVMGRIDNIERFKKPTLTSVFDIPEYCPPDNINSTDVQKRACEIAMAASGVGSLPIGGKPDLKPDIFSYNLLNGSGQFIMDYNGEKGIPRPYNSTKITALHPWGYIDGIEIIDEKGLIYTFKNQIFQIQYYNSCMNSTIPINTDDTPNYKLTNIQLPNKEFITYTFGKSTSSTYLTSISEQKNIYNKLGSEANATYLAAVPTNCKNTTYSTDKGLTEITFGEGKVLFFYNNDSEGFTENVRQDLRGDIYLTRVIVKNNANHIIKDISLHYDYFISQNEDPNTYPEAALDYPDVFKRLKLTSVKDNLSLGEYKLTYYGDDTGVNLPNRLSYSQDFWGVYNGQLNTTGIATVKAKDWGNNFDTVYLGGNKEPDINYGIIGNLKKIQYPNGGYTEIFYEADDYIKYSNVPDVYNYTVGTSGKVYDPNSIEFTIPANTFNRQIVFFDPSEPVPTIPPKPWIGTGCEWKLYKKTGNAYPSLPGATGHGTGTVDRLQLDTAESTYKLTVSKSTSGDAKSDEEKCSAEYIWLNEIVVNTSETRKTGTIRVEKIESNSLDNGKIIRNFSYINPNTGQSSGKNAGEELFVSLSLDEIAVGPPGSWGSGRFATQLNRVNNPGWQTATVRGKAVGYDYVQEIYQSSSDANQNYKKQYKFKNEIYRDSQYNFATTVNISWPIQRLDRGLLLEEKLFNKNGDTIRKTVNEYEVDSYFNQFATMNDNPVPFNSSEPFIGRALEIRMYNYHVAPGGARTYNFRKNGFDVSNIWIKNVKTTTTDYVNNQPTLVTEQTTAYSTSTPRHTFPIEQKSEVIGTGSSTSQLYQYAQDKNKTKLIEANMVGIPLETETKKNDKTISKTYTDYPDTLPDTQTGNLLLPKSVSALDLLTGGMSTEVTYNQYDSKGNILQYTTKNGVPTAIIWDKSQTQPIAKVEGATYAQASAVAGDIVTASDQSQVGYSETNLLTKLDAFRNDTTLNGFQITTYTYKPLIGVTSITPPSGIREVYIYDTANRLQEVRDAGGKLLKSYEYHYKP